MVDNGSTRAFAPSVLEHRVVDYAERESWLTPHLDTRIALISIDSPCRLQNACLLMA